MQNNKNVKSAEAQVPQAPSEEDFVGQKKELFELLQEVKRETGHDIRQLSIDFRRIAPVHFIEYRAFENAWQPRVFNLTYRQAKEYLTGLLQWALA